MDQRDGIRDHSPGIRDLPWDGDQLFSEGSGTKICHGFGIKDQKFGYKNGINAEKTYLVTQ